MQKRHSAQRLVRALMWAALGLALSACAEVHVTNNTPEAVAIRVAIPDAGGQQVVGLRPGVSVSFALGDSGSFSVDVYREQDFLDATAKSRDRIEAALKNVATGTEAQRVREELAVERIITGAVRRAAGCGGRVTEGDGYVTLAAASGGGVVATCFTKPSE